MKFGASSVLGKAGFPSELRVKKVSIDCSPSDLFLRIHDRCEYAFLLESMKGPEKLADFSFVGFKPKKVLTAKNGVVTLEDMESDEETTFTVSDPLVFLRGLIGVRISSGRFRFVGGAVGYVSYDAVRYWERIPDISVDDLNFPDFHMGIYDDGIIFDHVSGGKFYFYHDENRLPEIAGFAAETETPERLTFTTPRVNIEKDRYEELVQKAKAYISSGDILQVVLSKRYDFEVNGDLIRFYSSLRKINPSPYMYFLKMGKKRIIGSSPEMLVRVDGNYVETFPIAGTRPRLKDDDANAVLARDLLCDPKERAEHVMLVDLARNDIGRVSRFGTIDIPEFMKVHEYSHVQHIVSCVRGHLRKDCDCFDALRAVFPAGTVSGAPKVRAMEIIEESEPTRRGPYAGAVGYFSYNGNADFAITIRTLVAEGNRCSIQAGGGIVADSVPEKEWFETEYKAKALMKALEIAEDSE
ncbi:anthranilate synthase component I [Candidatus Bathyarchaeota archaeon]|nr:anthranilate synthase component I [Candidatus Bathyarchaeota archaeon]